MAEVRSRERPLAPQTVAALQALPEERTLVGVALVTQEHLAAAMQELTPLQTQYLRMRAMATSDTEGRHLTGRERKGGSQRRCDCRMKTAGWTDLREGTLLKWKHQPKFLVAYQALLSEPAIYAATRLESLAPQAVQVLADSMAGHNGAKPGEQIRASERVLEGSGVLRGQGQEKAQSGVQSSLGFRIARERLTRGLELSSAQRLLLTDAGVDVEVIPGAIRVRDLDGNDSLLPA
jgi:hypothetical protein